VEQGRPGRCWPGQAGEASGRAERVERGQGGPGRVQGQAWPGWHRPGRLGSGTAGTGPDVATARGAVGGSGGARRYTMRGRDVRERSERKKGRDRVYSLMFVGSTHQPMNISGLTYVAAVACYVRRPADEHKLHMSV
jgi:hypothetical protein